ncbi:hypothetical protein AC249_AIPGENE21651 [Exaiptasia diaphana]|nr:hypothetical protein AC249_AIPGENE21651 [Exaiptasia diaphana]
MLGQALRQARTALFRRRMTTGRMPDHIGEGGQQISTAHQVTALTCIGLALLGPGVFLMLTRKKPTAEH